MQINKVNKKYVKKLEKTVLKLEAELATAKQDTFDLFAHIDDLYVEVTRLENELAPPKLSTNKFILALSDIQQRLYSLETEAVIHKKKRWGK